MSRNEEEEGSFMQLTVKLWGRSQGSWVGAQPQTCLPLWQSRGLWYGLDTTSGRQQQEEKTTPWSYL